MAEIKSPVYTKQTAVNGGKMDPVTFGGKIRVVVDGIEIATSAAVGDTIALARLPQGAKVLPGSTLFFTSGLNASTTIKVGDAGDDDRYLAAVAVGSAAKDVKLDALKLTGGYVCTSETVVYATVGGAAITSGTKIGVQLEYVKD